MSIAQLLQQRLSKAETVQLAKSIGCDSNRFAEVMALSLKGDESLSPRAAWLMDYILEDCPELLLPHLAKAINAFCDLSHHNAIHRNLGKSLQRVAIPDELQGTLYDICIKHLLSPAVAVAVRAHAMELATRIALPYEELRMELTTVIKEVMQEDSPAMKARGRLMLKQLQ